jgi:hypothetical protein
MGGGALCFKIREQTFLKAKMKRLAAASLRSYRETTEWFKGWGI